MSLNRGARLGPYEIVSPLGAGGMGEVYLARDTRLDRSVAIKVLPEHLSEDMAARQRLEREARAVSSLNHPHICALYDIGQQDDRYYLVLEHLEGQTLADRLRRGALPLDEVLRVAREIADALHAAHRQGVVHRDLKPGNVMLTKSGAKLLDFGLARSAEAKASTSSLTAAPTATSPLTAEGTVAGTLQYMAPEQLETGQADVRSDVFAFGVLLYEMVTGHRAFTGKTQASLIAAILREQPPPVSGHVPLDSPELEHLVKKCLCKDPDERRQSMKDVLIDLEWIQGAESRGRTVPRTRSRRAGWTWALAALSILLAAALGLTLKARSAGPARVIRAMIPLPEKTTFDLDMVNPGPPALSNDGRRIVFAARQEGGLLQLWVRELDDLEATPIAGTENGGYPFWSPDDKSLGFFSQGELKRVDLDVGRPVKLCDAPIGKGGTWNRDGTILFAPSFNSGIHRISQEGGASEPITVLREAEKEISHRFPSFLPDGNHFLYLREFFGLDKRSEIMVGSLDGTSERRLVEADSQAAYSAGHLLYLRDQTLIAQPFDAARIGLTGEAFRVVDGVAQLPGTGRGAFSSSDDGTLVYQPAAHERAMEILWVDRKGERLESLGNTVSAFDALALAPDGKRVAVAVRGAPTQNQDIWLYDTENGQRTRFTFSEGATSPVWSPDGESLVFMASVKGVLGLYRKSVRGSENTPLDVPLGAPQSWSPDGRFIAMTVPGPDTGADVWILPTSGDRERYVYVGTKSLEMNPSFSPDGRWVAYASNETGAFEVYVGSFEEPERRWQVSTQGGQSPNWRGDGKELYYVGPGRVLVAAQLETEGSVVKVMAEERLFPFVSYSQNVWQGYAVSSDGKRFLIQRFASGEDPSAGSMILVSNWRSGLGK